MAGWRFGLVLTVTMLTGSRVGFCDVDDPNYTVDRGEGDENCHMTSQSFYSFVVRVWNTDNKNTSAHGSILSYTSVITTCAPFVELDSNRHTVPRDFNKFVVVAQKIRNSVDPDWSLDGPNTCFQKRYVASIIKHPKCTLEDGRDMWFNFAVLRLQYPFLALSQFTYPVIQLPNTVYSCVYYVLLVNVLKYSGCEIPLWYYHAHEKPTFASNMGVRSIRWLTECLPMFCEMDPFVYHPGVFRYPGQFPAGTILNEARQKEQRLTIMRACINDARKLMNFTNLCVYFPHSSLIKVGHGYMDVRSHLWTGGAPLVCNGTSIGITSSAKDRSTMREFRQDFYHVTSFVRVWVWLLLYRRIYGQTWLRDHLLEKDMAARNPKPVEPPPTPPVDPNLARSWPDDPNLYGEKSLSTRNQQPIAIIGSVITTISILLFPRVRIVYND